LANNNNNVIGEQLETQQEHSKCTDLLFSLVVPFYSFHFVVVVVVAAAADLPVH
jgi:hypothetical protein